MVFHPISVPASARTLGARVLGASVVGVVLAITMGAQPALAQDATLNDAAIRATTREMERIGQTRALMDWRQGLGFSRPTRTQMGYRHTPATPKTRPAQTPDGLGRIPGSPGTPQAIAGEYVVTLSSPELAKTLRGEEPALVHSGVLSPTTLLAELSPAQATALANRPGVLEVAPNALGRLTSDNVPGQPLGQLAGNKAAQPLGALSTPATAAQPLGQLAGNKASQPIAQLSGIGPDPIAPEQWNLRAINVPHAHQATTGSKAVKVAVIDSGIWADHPDLQGQVSEFWHTGTGVPVPSGPNTDTCRVGHGTLVAGVIGAIRNNGEGIMGIAPDVTLIDINAVPANPCQSGPSLAAAIASINLARERGADVAVMSFGFRSGYCSLALQQAIDQATKAGMIIVAASGNHGQTINRPEEPAACNHVLGVGAAAAVDRAEPYSTTSPFVSLSAPGGALTGGTYGAFGNHIPTTNWPEALHTPQGLYIGVTGTSFAAPQVAGIAALIRSVAPNAPAQDVSTMLMRQAQRAQPAHSNALGWGVVNGDSVVHAQATGVPADPPLDSVPYPVGMRARRMGRPTITPLPMARVHADSAALPPGATPADQAILEAVAISQATFKDAGDPSVPGMPGAAGFPRGRATWAVLARADVHADALTGAPLTMGTAPLLYTDTTHLSPTTSHELARILPQGGTVYVLGSTGALSDQVLDDLANQGLQPVRLGGATREDTAVSIAHELKNRVNALGLTQVNTALIANRDAWPDAIGAGYLGAQSGIPVLLTDTDTLSPATQSALTSLAINDVLVVGGTTRISTGVEHALATTISPDWQPPNSKARPFTVTRLAGSARETTLMQVGATIERYMAAAPGGIAALSMDTPGDWPTVLAASVPASAYDMVPVATHPSRVDGLVSDYVRGLGVPVVGWGSQVGQDEVWQVAQSSGSQPVPYPDHGAGQ